MADPLVIVGQYAVGEEYLAQYLGQFAQGHGLQINPVTRILGMLRYPDQAAILWPDKICEIYPLRGGMFVRLPVIRKATLEDIKAMSLHCDYGASVRFAGLDAIKRARTDEQRLLIALPLAGRKQRRVRSAYSLTQMEVDELKLIPEAPYREVESRLRIRKKARQEAETLIAEALSDAVSLTGPLARDSGSGKGPPGDPPGRGADKVLRAREKLAETEAWEAVFRKTETDFPPGSEQHKITALHYEAGLTLAEIAAAMHYDRQTIRRKRDEFVYRAAWYAAEGGLTK